MSTSKLDTVSGAKGSAKPPTPGEEGCAHPARSRPTYRPEPEGGTTPDLFAAVAVVNEHTLGQRLLQQGADLYCTGEFATLAERLRHVIVRERFATVICGRDSVGKIETYQQAYARVTGELLVPKKVPREQQTNITSKTPKATP